MGTRTKRRARRTKERQIDPAVAAMGKRLRVARDAAGVPRSKLAATVGVDASTIQRWELGWFPPDAMQLSVIARACGVTDAWLLHGTGRGPSATAAA